MAEELDDAQTMEVIHIVEREIAQARAEDRVISREHLVQVVSQETKMQGKLFDYVVEQYCDQNAPGIPGFLRSDVESPFLRIATVVNVLLMLGSGIAGVVRFSRGEASWPFFVASVVFCGLSLLTFYNSTKEPQA